MLGLVGSDLQDYSHGNTKLHCYVILEKRYTITYCTLTGAKKRHQIQTIKCQTATVRVLIGYSLIPRLNRNETEYNTVTAWRMVSNMTVSPQTVYWLLSWSGPVVPAVCGRGQKDSASGHLPVVKEVILSCVLRPISTANSYTERGCAYYYQRLSSLDISPVCSYFSLCCYPPASQRNKYRPWIVPALK